MKKVISVFLCLALLFSLGVFASAEDAPKLNLTASKASADAFSSAPGQYVNFMCSFWNCSYFESFEILITYNPEVLEYSSVYPLPKTEVVKHAIDCTVIQPGKLQVIGNNTCDYGESNEFDPFCLKVIGNGDTDISVEVVSFKTADGEVEDVVFDANIQNFTVTQEEEVAEKPIVCIMTQNLYTASKNSARCDILVVSVAYVENFERCKIDITLNTPPYRSIIPIAVTEPLTSSTQYNNCFAELSQNLITLETPMKNEDAPFAVFMFSSEEDVPLDFTINSVKLYTTDGEVEKDDFVIEERRFNNGDFVRYDLNGDNKITAEDARLALRFAVGLDTATDAQCRAAGVRDADSFTSEFARFLLRAAVGLEDKAEKVVTNVEWAADGDTAYLVYHYSDSTYETVGPMDAQLGKPDWF